MGQKWKEDSEFIERIDQKDVMESSSHDNYRSVGLDSVGCVSGLSGFNARLDLGFCDSKDSATQIDCM